MTRRNVYAVWVAQLAFCWVLFCALVLHARLVPDTYVYTHSWTPRSVVGSLSTYVGGVPMLAVWSGLAVAVLAGFLVWYGTGWRLLLGLGALFLWACWPSVDALGAAVVCIPVWLGRSPYWGGLSFLVHPVAGLAWFAGFCTRSVGWWYGALFAGLASAYVVGVMDTFSTTERYLLPGVLLAVSRR